MEWKCPSQNRYNIGMLKHPYIPKALRRSLSLLAAVVLIIYLVEGARADSAPIGFELYSWKSGKNWKYAVFEGTTTARDVSTIESKETALKGITFLKGRLAVLPTGESVYWRKDPRRGLRLPPREIIKEIADYAEAIQVHFILPEDLEPTR